MHMFQNLIDKLKAHPRKIVFTEGTDPRILEASGGTGPHLYRRMLLAGSFLLPVILCVHFIHDKYKLSGWQTRGRLSRT